MQYPIGKVAKAFGLTKETLRYYERSGVMPSYRGENGYRFYEKKQLQNMAVIRRMQNIGFSLKEISALMTDYSGERLFAKLESSIQIKEEELRYQMALLKRLREDTAFLRKQENYDRPYLTQLPVRYAFYFDNVEMLVNDKGIREDIIRWYARMYPALGLETLRWEDISRQTPRRIGLTVDIEGALASGFPLTDNIVELPACRAVEMVTVYRQEPDFFLRMAPRFQEFAGREGVRYQKEFHLIPNFSYTESDGQMLHIVRIHAPVEE